MPDRAERPAGPLMGLDYGTRRIGLAVGERRLARARPLAAVANTNGTPDWSALDARIGEWRPSALVVGWPLDADGTEQPLTAHVRGFVRRLRRRYERPVHTVDERYSSIEAGERLAALRAGGQRRRRTSRADVDAAAAALILERWFALDDVVAPDGGRPDTVAPDVCRPDAGGDGDGAAPSRAGGRERR